MDCHLHWVNNFLVCLYDKNCVVMIFLTTKRLQGGPKRATAFDCPHFNSLNHLLWFLVHFNIVSFWTRIGLLSLFSSTLIQCHHLAKDNKSTFHSLKRTRRWTWCAFAISTVWPWPLTFDLQNLIRPSVGAIEYSLYVSSRLFKQFMRYCGNKIYQANERTDDDKRGGRTAWNHDAFTDLSSGEGITALSGILASGFSLSVMKTRLRRHWSLFRSKL